MIDSIGEKRDILIILESVGFQDDYEGNFDTRRALIHTLQFTAKTYLFGPVADTTDGLIRKVQVDMYTSTDTKTAKREVRYTVTPTSKVDRNNDGVINEEDHKLLQPGDDFGFSETTEFFADAKNFSPVRKIDV